MADSQQVNQTLKALRAEAADLRRRLSLADAAIEALEAFAALPSPVIVTGNLLAELPTVSTNGAASGDTGDEPRGIEAVLRVLKELKQTPLTIREITAEIQQRGWIREDAKAPIEATRVALRRLIDKDDHVFRLDDGRWAYFDDPADRPGSGTEGLHGSQASVP